MTFNSAMIFAAGFGTRMGSLTKDTPKPLLQVHGRPMIDHCIDLLRDAGITHLVANTHYLPDALEAHLEKRGVITLREERILETGGGLKAALPFLQDGPIVTMNPDALWEGPNPVKLLGDAWQSNMKGLLSLCDCGRQADDFSLEHGEIRRSGPFRFTGLQAICSDQLCEIGDQVFSLNQYWDLIMKTSSLNGVIYPGKWTDIGTEEALNAANLAFQA